MCVSKRTLISLLFAFVMTLLFVILTISMGLNIGVFNSRSIIKSIDQSDYYNKAYDRIKQKTETILSEFGLPEDTLSEVITPSRVHADGINYVNARLNNKSQYKPEINKDIELHIQQYILNQSGYQPEQQSVQQSDQQLEESSSNIHRIGKIIEEEYKSAVELRFVDYLMTYKANYKKLNAILLPIIFLLMGILSYMLIRMYRHRYRGIRYIAYAMIASSILTLFTVSIWLLRKDFIGFEVSPDYYQQFVSNYVRMGLMVYVYMGIMGLIIAATLITLIGLMRNKIVYKK